MSGGVFWSQKGWDKLRKKCDEMHDLVVKVGIQGDKAAEKHDEGGDLTNAEIAAVHEFSEPSDKPPGRPFIRPIYDNAPEKWKGELKDACQRVLAGGSARGELRKIGEEYRTAVIDRMKAGISPPLSEQTINRRKGQTTEAKRDARKSKWAKTHPGSSASGLSETPLIDSGTLMGALSVEVVKK